MDYSQTRQLNLIKVCLVIGIISVIVDVVGAMERRSLQAESVYDIMKFDAKGDGKTDDGPAWIKAFRAGCDGAGPARILIPAGKDFMMGEVVLKGPCKGPIILDIQGTLLANTDPSAYSNSMWILIDHTDNVKILGGGTLNGRGQGMWKTAGEDNHMPVGLTFQSGTNGDISNLKLIDAMGFHSKIIDSKNVKVTGLTITAPDESPNTDGIHLSNATNIDIIDNVIGTGDDCVSIGTGSTNVLVKNLKCGPGHGLAVGSLGKRPDELPVKNLTFLNCTCIKTTNGARIKTYHASPALTATAITFQDITMTEVKNPILIDQHYFSKTKPEQSSIAISDVHFKNIKGTTITKTAINFNCSTKVPCKDIELADIDLKPVPPLKAEEIVSVCQSAVGLKPSGALVPPAPKC